MVLRPIISHHISRAVTSSSRLRWYLQGILIQLGVQLCLLIIIVCRNSQPPTQFSEHANYATDGHLLTKPKEKAEFILRSLFMMCNWTMKLMSNGTSNMDITSNYDIFRRAFMVDGEICPSWNLAPGHRFERGDDGIAALFRGESPGPIISQDDARTEVIEKWDRHRAATSAHIPFLGLKGAQKLSVTAERALGNGTGRLTGTFCDSSSSLSILILIDRP